MATLTDLLNKVKNTIKNSTPLDEIASSVKNYFDPTYNQGQNFRSTPVAQPLANIRQTIDTGLSNLKTNLGDLKSNFQLIKEAPDTMIQSIPQSMQDILTQLGKDTGQKLGGDIGATVGELAGRTVGGLEKGFTTALISPFTSKPLPSKISDIIGGVGSTALAGETVGFAALNPVFTTVGTLITKGRLPTKDELMKSYSEGIDFGSKFAPISKVTTPVTSAILSKYNPQEIKTAVDVIKRLAVKGLGGATGFGTFGYLTSDKTGQGRIKDTIDNAIQGALFDMGAETVGMAGRPMVEKVKNFIGDFIKLSPEEKWNVLKDVNIGFSVKPTKDENVRMVSQAVKQGQITAEEGQAVLEDLAKQGGKGIEYLKNSGLPNPQKSIDWINAIVKKQGDETTIRKAIDILSDGKSNPITRRAFEMETGVKLPKTQKESRAILENMAGLSPVKKSWATTGEVKNFINANKGKEVYLDRTKRDWQAGRKTKIINPEPVKIVGMDGNRVVYMRGKGEFSVHIDQIRDITDKKGKSLLENPPISYDELKTPSQPQVEPTLPGGGEVGKIKIKAKPEIPPELEPFAEEARAIAARGGTEKDFVNSMTPQQIGKWMSKYQLKREIVGELPKDARKANETPGLFFTKDASYEDLGNGNFVKVTGKISPTLAKSQLADFYNQVIKGIPEVKSEIPKEGGIKEKDATKQILQPVEKSAEVSPAVQTPPVGKYQDYEISLYNPDKNIKTPLTANQAELLKNEVSNIPFVEGDRTHLNATKQLTNVPEVSLEEFAANSPSGRQALSKVGLLPQSSESSISQAGAGIPEVKPATAKIKIKGAKPMAEGSQISAAESGKLPETNLKNDFLATRNARIAETNQLANQIDALVKNPQDREALYIYHELRNNPDKIAQVEDLLAKGNEQLKPYEDVIQKALNPTPEMIKASDLLSQYFNQRKTEGLKLGYIKGDIKDYITHIIDQGENAQPLGSVNIPRPSMTQWTPFGQGRTYPTIIDAILNGKKPATLNASDILRIYGSRDAVANASTKFVNAAKDAGLGGWFHPDEIPNDWVRLDQYGRHFEHTIAVSGRDGQPIKVTQTFAVPKQIADSMKPVIEPDWLRRVGAIDKWRWAQSWAKYINLSLSFFHAKALTITAANSEPMVIAKAITTDMNSPEFKQAELDLIKDGGTSPILGGEYNAYRNISNKSKNILVSNPITDAFNALAEKTNGITFDTIARKFKVLDYSMKKASWLADHPDATPEEVKAAGEKIATYVNDAYGGLNWEKMGVNKSSLTLLRSLLLAPDWTFSNLAMIPQAIKGEVPVGQSAKFVAMSFATGIVLTQLTNLLLNKKMSNDPFNVTLGYRKDGTEVKANLYFSGSTKDLVNLVTKGPIDFVAGKLAPFINTLAQEITNKDYFGNPIRNPGKGIIGNTLSTAQHLAGGLPIPFSLSSPFQLFTGAKNQGSSPLPAEILLAATGMGRISTKRPARDAYTQAYNDAIGQGKSDMEAQLAGINAEKSVKAIQTMGQLYGQSGQDINTAANTQLDNIKAQLQLKKDLTENKTPAQSNDLFSALKSLVGINSTPKENPVKASYVIDGRTIDGYVLDNKFYYIDPDTGDLKTSAVKTIQKSEMNDKQALLNAQYALDAERFKRMGNIEGWLDATQKQIQNLKDYQSILNPITDKLKIIALQKTIEDLQASYDKYKSYGGFKAPPKIKTSKSLTLKIKKVKPAKLKTTSLRVKVARPRGGVVLKIAKPKAQTVGIRIPKQAYQPIPIRFGRA